MGLILSIMWGVICAILIKEPYTSILVSGFGAIVLTIMCKNVGVK